MSTSAALRPGRWVAAMTGRYVGAVPRGDPPRHYWTPEQLEAARPTWACNRTQDLSMNYQPLSVFASSPKPTARQIDYVERTLLSTARLGLPVPEAEWHRAFNSTRCFGRVAGRHHDCPTIWRMCHET